MTAVSERQRRVAASFTRQYYTLMVQQPEKLSAFYTPHATFDHMGHKAEGTADIEATIAELYPVQPNGSAQIHNLSVETTANGNINVTIKGSITTALNVTHNFTHDVELTEHKTHPGSFGIVNDKRERTIQEEALQRWALETPPMFAQEARKDAMEPIEQPATTTAVRALEKSPSKKSVESLKKAESPASEKVATVNSTVRESSATVTAASVSPDSCVAASATDATLETVAEKKLEEEGATTTTTTATPSTSAANTEPKKPKSFAEAIMMGKRTAGAQGHATPLKVVAKGGKEQSTEEPVKEKKEKNRDSAVVAERNGTKGAHRNGTNVKKPSTATTSAEGEKKNGKPNAVSGNNKEGSSNNNNNNTTNTTTTSKNNNNHNNNHNNNNNNNNNTSNNNNKNNRRKDAEGRTLSRYVVFYDIIVKGLPHDATEETVRDIIGTSAPVKLVNVRSQPDKKDPGVIRTFAFVQLDHNALKEAGDDVKATVAKIVSAHKGKKGPAGQRYQIDEVREKYTAVPAEASA